MNSELISTVVLTTALVLVTIVIAYHNYKLTSNTEKFSHGNLIINLQDKLSDAILQEQEMIQKYYEYFSLGKSESFLKDRSINKIEAFMIRYLNITNAIAYLFVMEKSILGKNHKKYFEFYLAYAEKLLAVKNSSTENDQFKYWPYITPCIDKYDMQSDKSVPAPIQKFFKWSPN